MLGIASLPIATWVIRAIHIHLLLIGKELAEVRTARADTHDRLLLAWVGLVHELRVWLFSRVASDAKLTAHVPVALMRIMTLICLPLG